MWSARDLLLLLVVAARARASPLLQDVSVSDDHLLCVQQARAAGRDESECKSMNDVTNSGPQTIILSRDPRQADLEMKNITNKRLACLLEAQLGVRPKSECDSLAGRCTCVPFWQCSDDLTQPGVDGGLVTVVNLRVNSLACSIVEEVCCENVNKKALPPNPNANQVYEPRCGQRHPDGFGANFQGFIDRQAQFGEFPWMAAVLSSQVNNGTNDYIGGASLIHPQVVLTVAHKVYEIAASQLLVRLGEWNFRETSESRPHQDFLVRRIMFHPKYNPSTLNYDVAMLFLDGMAELGPTVDTICLPEPLQEFSGAACFTSGWGKDSFTDNGSYQQIMKSIQLPASNNSVCQDALRTTRLGPNFLLDQSFMCAGGEVGLDTCTGDGGSPLVCPMPSDSSRYVQVGVVAWGIGCGQQGIPGVYAAVSHAVSWIDQELQNNFAFDIRAQI